MKQNLSSRNFIKKSEKTVSTTVNINTEASSYIAKNLENQKAVLSAKELEKQELLLVRLNAVKRFPCYPYNTKKAFNISVLFVLLAGPFFTASYFSIFYSIFTRFKALLIFLGVVFILITFIMLIHCYIWSVRFKSEYLANRIYALNFQKGA